MKLKKALAKLSAYLSAKQREQLEERDSIKKVLKKLKTKRDHLRKRLDGIDDKAEHKHLQKKLEVVTAQRQKGLQALKELKSAHKTSK
ncbi:MAG: hypothetical protein R3F53_00180 [Gammaproteobacteria bacterium]